MSGVVLVGGGGHCRSCVEALVSAGISIAGVLAPEGEGTFAGQSRLGGDEWLDTAHARQHSFLVAVGQIAVSSKRAALFETIRGRGLKPATVLASSAIVSTGARIGEGSIVLHGAVVNTAALVGENCIVNTGAIIEHDARIGDHCHVSTGAIVNGGAEVGMGCVIGSGAILLQGVRVAPGVLVGAGAVVTRDITKAGTWIGIPARMRT